MLIVNISTYVDGNLVKSDVTTQGGTETITYYVSGYYNVQVIGSNTTVQKFYTFGSQTVAIQTSLNGAQSTLNWVVTDNLNSTTITANADGTFNSELRYSAFGEIRYSSGTTPTNYQYTGQLSQPAIGMDFYVARWYDPYLAHFVQADTEISDPSEPQTFDRYMYSNNNPITYNDPSGCDAGCTGMDCGDVSAYQSSYESTDEYNSVLSDERWTDYTQAVEDSYDSSPITYSSFSGHWSWDPVNDFIGGFTAEGLRTNLWFIPNVQKDLSAQPGETTSTTFGRLSADFVSIGEGAGLISNGGVMVGSGVAETTTGIGLSVGAPSMAVGGVEVLQGAGAGISGLEGFFENSNIMFAGGGETPDTIRGREAHQNYRSTLGDNYDFEQRLPSGKRVDAIDALNGIVRELKPDNADAIARGLRQLNGYVQELQQTSPGKIWQAFLDVYRK